jgi:hypothetical protein
MVGSVRAEHTDFLDLVIALRKLGAVSITDGPLTAVFSAPLVEQVETKQKPYRQEITEDERTELNRLREDRHFAEELGL